LTMADFSWAESLNPLNARFEPKAEGAKAK